MPESLPSWLTPAISHYCASSLSLHPGRDGGIAVVAPMCHLSLLAPIFLSLLSFCFVLWFHLLTSHVATEASLDLGGSPVGLRVIQGDVHDVLLLLRPAAFLLLTKTEIHISLLSHKYDIFESVDFRGNYDMMYFFRYRKYRKVIKLHFETQNLILHQIQ